MPKAGPATLDASALGGFVVLGDAMPRKKKPKHALIGTPAAPLDDRYDRRAEVRRLVDGDTIDLDVDLGFGSWYRGRFRLAGVDTPEKYGVRKDSDEYRAGLAASAFAEQWLNEHAGPRNAVVIRSYKEARTGKYGRWLAEVFPHGGDGQSLNAALVEAGHAELVDW